MYLIKRQNFPANSAEKLGPLRKKVWPHSNFSFFGVICTTKSEKSSILLGLTLSLERKIYQIINKKSIGKAIFYLKLADTIA
jgi:hypothetical protein